MKLSSFLIGMLAAAFGSVFVTLALGGSWMLAVVMCITTLVVAQILYVLLLVLMARWPGAGKKAPWPAARARAFLGRGIDLNKTTTKNSAGPDE